MNTQSAIAFADEMEKIAVGGFLWRSALSRAGVGAAGGAAAGAVANPEDRKRGALVGGALGALGGWAAPLATRAGRAGAKSWMGRAYEAQKHGLTGKGRMPTPPKASAKEIGQIREAEKAGLTSLPGLVKGMVRKPRETIRAAWKTQSTPAKLLTGGFAAMEAPRVLDRKTQEGTGEKALQLAGDTGGYFMASRMGMVPGVLASVAAGTAGKYIGRGVDRLRGYRPPPEAAPQSAGRRIARVTAANAAPRAIGQ